MSASRSAISRKPSNYTKNFDMELVASFPFSGPQYSQIMGLDDVQWRMAVVRKGGFMLELFEFERPTLACKDAHHPVSDRGITHFGIDVEDIEETYERLVAAGVLFHCPVMTFPSGMKATYGRDLDGNVFELLETSKR